MTTACYVIGAIEYLSVSLVVARVLWLSDEREGNELAPVGFYVVAGVLWPVWTPIYVIFPMVNRFVSTRSERKEKKA